MEPGSRPVFDYVVRTLSARCGHNGLVSCQHLTHEGAQYLDGAHEWHHDGFAHLLIDLMLRPGGIIEFDDYWWHVLMLLFIGFAHCCQRGRVC